MAEQATNRNRILIFGVVIVLVVVLAGLFWLNNSGLLGGANGGSSSANTQPLSVGSDYLQGNSSDSAAPLLRSIDVIIEAENGKLEPNNFEVKAGDLVLVTLKNNTGSTQVFKLDAWGANSGSVAAAEEVTFQLLVPGDAAVGEVEFVVSSDTSQAAGLTGKIKVVK